MQTPDPEKRGSKLSVFNIALLALTGQVGCITVLIVLGAIFLGLWLDSIFQTKPIITFVALIISIPISVVLMLVIARATVKKIQIQAKQSHEIEEETGFGTNQDTS